MKGKMKTVHGIYKKHGREEFLEAAKCYSCHVHDDSIDRTIDEMESRWHDSSHTMTEAEKMVADYNDGLCTLSENCSLVAAERIYFKQEDKRKSQALSPVEGEWKNEKQIHSGR